MHVNLRTPLILLALLILGGCTPTLQIQSPAAFDLPPATLDLENPEYSWWQMRFRLTWPEDEAPDFSRHLLIAEQLLLSPLSMHQQQLPLWRFHRRAGRDGVGHQFSLIIYADSNTAAQFEKDVQSKPLTQWLIDRGMLEAVTFEQRSPDEMGRLELTSDPEWPIEIQRSWPYFIMGASQAWLMLVTELSAEIGLAVDIDYPGLLQHYQAVDERLSAQWQDNGQHAYLHHLSALFGYRPILIRSRELKSF